MYIYIHYRFEKQRARFISNIIKILNSSVDNFRLRQFKKQYVSNRIDLWRLPTVQPIFGHLGNTSALINMSYFFQLDMKI